MRGRVCVVVDDMIDTGGTIVKAAETLFEQGAADVIVAATHGILSDPAAERLADVADHRGHRHRHAADHRRRFDKLTVLSIAPLLATAIREVFTDGSVTRLFDPTPNGEPVSSGEPDGSGVRAGAEVAARPGQPRPGVPAFGSRRPPRRLRRFLGEGRLHVRRYRRGGGSLASQPTEHRPAPS